MGRLHSTTPRVAARRPALSNMLAARLLRPSGRRPSGPAIASARLVAPRIRNFHASAPRQGVWDAALYLPHEMLQLLHPGLPWYAAIPVSAFMLRGLLVFSFGGRVREYASRYVALHPLRSAQAKGIQKRLSKEGGFTSPKHAQHAISRAIREGNRDLDKRWRCSLKGQVGWTVAQLPVFVVMQEVIRRMTATKQGLFGLTMNSLGLGEDLGEGQKYSMDIANNPWFEASLANEGTLWFSNLLVPDPIGVLPWAVSFVMLSNVMQNSKRTSNPNDISAKSKVLKLTLMALSVSIGFIGQGLPASLLLYWFSSSCSASLWNVYLDRKYPEIKGIAPCKRPILDFPSPSAAMKR